MKTITGSFPALDSFRNPVALPIEKLEDKSSSSAASLLSGGKDNSVVKK